MLLCMAGAGFLPLPVYPALFRMHPRIASVASRIIPVRPDKTGIEAIGKIATDAPACRTFGPMPMNRRGDILSMAPFSGLVITPDKVETVAGHK